MPFLILPLAVFAKNLSDFEGEYMNRHSLYVTSEDRTVHGVEDIVKVQPVDKTKANILVETYSQNFHSCQLIGEAELQGEELVFKSSVSRKLTHGKGTACELKISQTQNEAGEKILKISDKDDNCRTRYCGMTAELGGVFKQKTVLVQDKK